MRPYSIARTRPASRLASGSVQHRAAAQVTRATPGPSVPVQRPHSSAPHAAAVYQSMAMTPQPLPPPPSLPTLPHVAPQLPPHYPQPPSSPILSLKDKLETDWYNEHAANQLLQRDLGARCFFNMFNTLLYREGIRMEDQQKVAFATWSLWPRPGKAVFQRYGEMQSQRDRGAGRAAPKPLDDWPPECAGYTVTHLAAHVRIGLDVQVGAHEKHIRRIQLWCLQQFNDAVANKARIAARQGGRPGRKGRFPRFEEARDWTRPANELTQDIVVTGDNSLLEPLPKNTTLEFNPTDYAMLSIILPYELSTRQILSNVFFEQQQEELTAEAVAGWTYLYYLTGR